MRKSAAATTGSVHCFSAALTSFIDRGEPTREVAGPLEEHRSATVTRPGAAGKTRLAGKVTQRVADWVAYGTWLAGLAPAHHLAHIAAVVMTMLGGEQPGIPVAEVPAQQAFRLVVDNREHVVDAAAQSCARLLAACDGVQVLATSREPLRVAGEARYRVGHWPCPLLVTELPRTGL